MAKANLTLPNGTAVVLEGSPEEVHRLLGLVSASDGDAPDAPRHRSVRAKGRSVRARNDLSTEKATGGTDLAAIVNLIKTCDRADEIEQKILDQKSLVHRILVPLYVISKYGDSSRGLTSGEISRITRELGVPVSQPNTSTALSSHASKYVMGDRVRRKGEAVSYQISRRGIQYLDGVLSTKERK
jgi:hypothetical protein